MFFAVVAVAICVLWVRSYWREYELRVGLPGWDAAFATARGVVYLSASKGGPRINFYSRTVNESQKTYLAKRTTLGFGLPAADDRGILVPTWFVALGCAYVSLRLYQNRMTMRFSLRSLLVVTTLVAGVLGLGVWLAS